ILRRQPAHRPILPFPTRRSSDLTFLSLYQSGVKMEVAINDALVVTKHLPHVFRPVLQGWHDRGGPEESLKILRNLDIDELKTCRSEEHTSELQSRFDLVCRHLLA